MLLLLLSLASYSDQCSAAVYDYALQECYVEDANPEDAVCSEFRWYGERPDM
jgi:hypothetical protein